MRIHLGHHFYGAGNLGDDFMVAGFLHAMRTLAPEATFTACVPFPTEPLARRVPQVDWHPYDESHRHQCVAACDAWLGLGGSPFQSAQSRWFIDHLTGDAATCRRFGKPMFYLGIGVQTASELEVPGVREVCAQAAGIWTRDQGSVDRLSLLRLSVPLTAAADLAHVFFRAGPPPLAKPRRLTVVPNFDYGTWPGGPAFLRAADRIGAAERVWLAQESRELPGAEKVLFAELPDTDKAAWRLVSPEIPGAELAAVIARWPSGEWLVTSRFHAALAGAWAGSKVVVIATNEKLRNAAQELGAPCLAPDADEGAHLHALQTAGVPPRPDSQAEKAFNACAGFIQAMRAV